MLQSGGSKPRPTLDLLVSNTLIAIQQIDDATAGKAVFEECFLHGDVIPVGVDADIAALRKGIVKAELGHTFAGSGYRNAMDHAAFTLPQPRTVIDPFIGGVTANKETEYAENCGIFFTDEEVTGV